MSSTSNSNDIIKFIQLPNEVQIHIGTYLRAYDLSKLQQTCTYFSIKDNRWYIHSIIHVFANYVYPPELTKGYETTPPLFGTNDPVKKLIEQTTSKSSRQGQTLRGHHGAGGNSKSINAKDACTTSTDSNVESTAVLTFEHLRDMEMLVLMRLLSLPEPSAIHGSSTSGFNSPGRTIMEDSTIDEDDDDDDHNTHHYYYVSKSWCKAALKWLESQEEERRRQKEIEEEMMARSNNSTSARAGGGKKHKHHHGGNGGKKNKKMSRKQQRIRSRRLSDVSPPWPNANQDLLCPHGELMRHSSKAARSKRRVMDKHAWKVLRKLYPDSVPLKCRSYSNNNNHGCTSPLGGLDVTMDHDSCLQCWAEYESEKRTLEQCKIQLDQERKKPLSNPLIRAFYVRASRGVPQDRIVRSDMLDTKPDAAGSGSGGGGGGVPLLPGVYHVIPRTWCQRWRRYMKNGGIDKQTACLPPDATDMLCDMHKLPLLPPHLEEFLCGNSIGNTLFPSTQSDSSSLNTATRDENINIISSRSSNGGSGYIPGEATSSLGGVVSSPRASTSSRNTNSHGEAMGITTALLAAAAADGISAINVERELESQFNAMANISGHNHNNNMMISSPSSSSSVAALASSLRGSNTATTNSSNMLAATERENQALVEIVTDEEFTALEQEFWPRMEGTCFTLRFDVAAPYSSASSSPSPQATSTTTPTGSDMGILSDRSSTICQPCTNSNNSNNNNYSVEWFYKPCRECKNDDLINILRTNPNCIERRMVVRNRVRNNLETNHNNTGENWKWKKPSTPS